MRAIPGGRRRPVAAALGLGLAIALVGAGCGSSGGSDGATPSTSRPPTTKAAGTTPDDLDGRTFVDTSAKGAQLADGGHLNLSFNGRQMSVAGGCNSLVGAYELVDGQLRWYDPPAASEMACAQPLMDQDTWLADWLVQGVEAELDGDRLTLSGDGATIELVDQASIQEDAPLVGTTWKLKTMIEGDVASSVPANAKAATITFQEDGTVEVFTGCNRGSTTATVSEDGTAIEFDHVMLTRMACGKDAATVETAVMAVVDGKVAAEVDGTTLTLTKGDRSIELFAS
ncbi:MAG: META domain-containing protein [Acidimicrobiales bacterium]